MRTIDEIKAELYEAKRLGKTALAGAIAYKLLSLIRRDISLDRLTEICNAERGGRLVVLPCKVGDTVYVVMAGKEIVKMQVGNIYPYGFIVKGQLCNAYLVTHCTYICATFYDIGKTVFLTREQAEQALKGCETE